MGRSLCHCEDRRLFVPHLVLTVGGWRVVLVKSFHRNSLVLIDDLTTGVPLGVGKVGSKFLSGFTLSGGTWG